MSLQLHEIKAGILDVIDDIDKIIEREDFSAYHHIRESCESAIVLLSENKINDSQKEIAFSIRLLMEAPPKDKVLGYSTLLKMDSIYKNFPTLVD